jgi:hypothetical protein
MGKRNAPFPPSSHSGENRVPTFQQKSFLVTLVTCASFWSLPAQASSQSVQTLFVGRIPETCSIVQLNGVATHRNNGSMTLVGNRGSVTSVCNTASTLSITVDKAASPISHREGFANELQNAKIRFTGGTGIYANASSSYQDTASFSSQQTTTAAGDTAQLEVDTVAPRAYSIVVYASLTPQ